MVNKELLDGMKKGNSSSKSFLACVDECFSERESKAFWILKQSYIYTRGLLSRVKSYKALGTIKLDQARMA